ncbi:MAG: peroxiredoxin-like family protein [Bacteroidota bacterium]
MNDQTQSLQAQLDARKAAWAEKASDHVKRAYQEGIDAVVEAGVESQAKQVGDKAPDFSLTNATGKEVRLSDYLKKGPVILTWYRGGWCPYCNITLRQLQLELPNFRAKGANLIALTPELPDKSLSTQEKHALDFEVLSDVGNTVARAYGIVFKLTEEVGEMYQNAFDLHAYNGDESKELPLAATYVIAIDGNIQYAFLDAEYRNRAEPSDILKVLDQIQA